MATCLKCKPHRSHPLTICLRGIIHSVQPLRTAGLHRLARNRLPLGISRVSSGNARLELHRHRHSRDIAGVGIHGTGSGRAIPSVADLAGGIATSLPPGWWDIRALRSSTVRTWRHRSRSRASARKHGHLLPIVITRRAAATSRRQWPRLTRSKHTWGGWAPGWGNTIVTSGTRLHGPSREAGTGCDTLL